MNLSALMDYCLVVTHQGFSRASRATGRSKATLSRQVASLEASLGVRLIERSSHRLRLTEEGDELYQRINGLLSEIEETSRTVASRATEPHGLLRISAPLAYAQVVLAAVGAQFAVRYPKVKLEIVASDHNVDPIADGFDLVIRVNPAPDALLIGKRMCYDTRVLVSANPPPAEWRHKDNALTLPTVTLLHHQDEQTWHIREGCQKKTIHSMPLLRLSSLLLVKEAVLSGTGVALLPYLLVKDELPTGRLILWGEEAGPPVEIWALYPSRRLLSAKVRAFIDMLQDEHTKA